MMARYFNPKTDKSHESLLPVQLRTNVAELEQVAREAEDDVVNHYTQHGYRGGYVETMRTATQVGDSGYYVFLRGYEADADDVDTTAAPNFKDDMAHAIAEVTRWRLEQKERQQVGVTVETDAQGRSREFTARFLAYPFPPNWTRWLSKYDTREQPWAL